jgi:uncharacterized protein YciI
VLGLLGLGPADLPDPRWLPGRSAYHRCMDFDQYTVALLVRRADAPAFTAEEEAELQDAHMAHLADLHAAGQLAGAGPLSDPDGLYRGLSILTVGVDEARALKEADPAVRAGKFAVLVVPWMVPGGAVSFQRAEFPRSVAQARS